MATTCLGSSPESFVALDGASGRFWDIVGRPLAGNALVTSGLQRAYRALNRQVPQRRSAKSPQ
jgi:hypothetical protein